MCAKTVVQGEPFPHSLHIKGFICMSSMVCNKTSLLNEDFSTFTAYVRFLSCEIQLVHPKGNQSWILIGRTDIEAETPVLWPPDAKS